MQLTYGTVGEGTTNNKPKNLLTKAKIGRVVPSPPFVRCPSVLHSHLTITDFEKAVSLSVPQLSREKKKKEGFHRCRNKDSD